MAKTSDYFETYMYPELVERREKLQDATRSRPADPGLTRLLAEIDAALSRIEEGSFGQCETCHDPIEEDRLRADPLLRFCLDHLTPSQQKDLEEDLEAAARVQRALVPAPKLEVPGWHFAFHYEPAGVVSGDCCDLFTPDGRKDEIFFVFGDVSGKGVSAAMLMSNLHATFRSLAAAGLPLPTLVEQANRIFRSTSLSRTFATLVVGRLSTCGKAEICNAGHCPPILVRGSEVETIAPTGLPIGTFYSCHYEATRVTLEPGDTLLLYTDGITEARNAEGEEFGAGRLEEMVGQLGGSPAPEFVSRVLDSVRDHLGRIPKADDLSLFVLQRPVEPAN